MVFRLRPLCPPAHPFTYGLLRTPLRHLHPPHRRFKSRLSFLARSLARSLACCALHYPDSPPPSRLKERWDGCACSQRRKMRRKEGRGRVAREGCGRKHYSTIRKSCLPCPSASYACSLGACSSASAQQSRLPLSLSLPSPVLL